MRKLNLYFKTCLKKSLKDPKGAVMPIVAICIFVLVGLLTFAIDIGWVVATNNELQNVADAGALAGTGELGDQYNNDLAADLTSIRTVAKDIAYKNQAANKYINLNDGDIELGSWDESNEFKTTCSGKCNAVKVKSRRDESANGPFTSFFASVLGIDQFSSSKDAVAALSGASEIDDGKLEIPVGISKSWFNPGFFCDQNIKFYPTSGTTGCAGWMTYDSWPANASKLKKILDGLKNGTFAPPGAGIDDEFVFIGGNVSSAQDNMYELWDTKRTQDGDGNDNIWTTHVVVYDAPCGDNPSGYIKLVGFATVKISGVEGPPPELEGKVICEKTTLARGGGGYFGTWGSIPNLVE